MPIICGSPVKVDRSFVAELDRRTPDADASVAIIRAIVSLARSLQLRTVAEGIETPGQLAAVTALGCDLGRGFFLGRPTPSNNIPAAGGQGVLLPISRTAAYHDTADLRGREL
jgi:EAL domain-containing protein (putative c-di-GMP-specific phosphodiesterase class I)